MLSGTRLRPSIAIPAGSTTDIRSVDYGWRPAGAVFHSGQGCRLAHLRRHVVLIAGILNDGRWIGIGSAALNSIVMLMFIPAYPFGALAVFAIDVLVIYGLAAYGGHNRPSF
jgi:hypothetical protein